MSIQSHSTIALLAASAAFGCGKDERNNTSPDAAMTMPDSSAPACTCSPAAVCRDTGCTCPAGFITSTSPVIANAMLAPPAAGYLSGAVSLSGTDAKYHSIIVTAQQIATLGQALPIGTGVYAAVGYDYASATSARSVYIANGGTVMLTRRCAGGIAGTLTNVTLVEADYQTLVPLPNGCTTTISSFAFDVGAACP